MPSGQRAIRLLRLTADKGEEPVTSRERVIRTLRHERVDRAPRELWALPGVYMFHGEELQEIQQRFPQDTTGPAGHYGQSRRAKGEMFVPGEYTDAWGCVWNVGEPGVIGEVKEALLKTEEETNAYQPPYELLDGADLSDVDAACAATDLFVKVGTEARPFERIQFLRGTEQLYMDLAYGTESTLKLLSRLHDFYCREIEMWAKTAVDCIAFMDDWGTQRSLLISPDMWREIFKPLYRDYCQIIHNAGKFVFMHSDGNTSAIYPDLIEIGVDALNSQLFCMDIEQLGRDYSGKITFWGEIDRQHVLPFGTEEEVRQAVRRVRKAMDHNSGGVVAQCEWGLCGPKENIAAVFDEWDKPRP